MACRCRNQTIINRIFCIIIQIEAIPHKARLTAVIGHTLLAALFTADRYSVLVFLLALFAEIW